MKHQPRILFVGLGSSHGDDQIGWLVVNAVSKHFPDDGDVMVRKAALPLDILDWLDGVGCLHVVDASRGEEPAGTVFRFETSSGIASGCQFLPELSRLHCSGSHDFGLSAVLELAERLGQLPDRIIVHAVAGKQFRSDDTVCEELEAVLPEVAHTILNELNHARSVPGTVVADSG